MTAISSLRGKHIYDHLGIRSTRTGPESGETRMPLTGDVRVAGGLRAAPLGLAFEQGVAQYLFDHVLAVPTLIALHVRDDGAEVEGIVSATQMVRKGRTLVVTEGTITDAADASRVVAFGSIIWAVIGEAPERAGGGAPPAPEEPFEPAGLDVVAAAGVVGLPDGSGCMVEGVTPATSGPGGILHAGMVQLMSEEAALVLGRRTLGTEDVGAVDCSYHFLQPGRVGPFVARAEAVWAGPDGLDARVAIVDEGSDGRTMALSHVSVARRG